MGLAAQTGLLAHTCLQVRLLGMTPQFHSNVLRLVVSSGKLFGNISKSYIFGAGDSLRLQISGVIDQLVKAANGSALPPAVSDSPDVKSFLAKLANETQFLGCPQGSNVQR